MYSYTSIVIYLLVTFNYILTIQCKGDVEFRIKGLVSTVFTPMDEAGRVNTAVIESYARYMKNNGIKCVLVAGTSGEGPNLSVCEKKRLFASWMQSAKTVGIEVIAQIGGVPLPDIIELAKYCEKIDVNALLVLPTLYYKPADPEQLATMMDLVAKAAPTRPILYYDYPEMSGVTVNMSSFFELASKRVPQFKGLKIQLPSALDVVASNKLRPDQRIFISNYVLISAAIVNGFDSFIATPTNAYPGLFFDLIKYAKSDNITRTEKAQERLTRLTDAIDAQGGYIPGLKAATEIVSGIELGNPRFPLPKLTGQNKNRIRKILLENGIKVKN